MNKIKQLNELIKYVKNNNDFYSNLYSDIDDNVEEISKLPILKRSMIRSNKEAVISKDFDIIKLKKDKTNGTTEKVPLEIYKSNAEWIGLDLLLWAKRRDINVDAAKRYVFYYYNGKDFSIDRKVKEHGESLTVQLPMRKSDEYKFVEDINFIKENNIKWIIAPPSLVYKLCEVVMKYGIAIKVEVVELISEYLPHHYKELFENVFKCKILIHYSCHEVWGMAFTNSDGELAIMNNVIIEQEKDERFLRDYGACVVTNLSLKSMPFIRYELTDLVKVEGNTIKTFGFRRTEEIKLKDFTIHCSFIDNIFLNFSLLKMLPLENYQIIYKKDTIMFYLINIEKEVSNKIKKYVSDKIYEQFNKKISIKMINSNRFYIDKISGKMRGIINYDDVDWEN